MSPIAYKGSTLNLDYGWVSPYGQYYRCAYMDHDLCAEAIVKEYYPEELKNDHNAARILEKHGYLRIIKSNLPNKKYEIIFCKKIGHVTEKQIEIVRSLGIEPNEIIEELF